MGMGKKSAPPQQTTAPTVTSEKKDYVDTKAGQNAAGQARVEENKSASLLQVKDDEELKRQQMVGVS